MIFLDISLELKRKAGIGVYILTLIKAFGLLNIPIETFEFKIGDKIKFKNIWYIIWLNTYLLIYTYIKKPEIMFFPSFFMPYFTRKKTKYITVIHDLAAERKGEMTKYFSAVFRFGTAVALKKSDTIITVSQTIKNEIIQKYNITPERIKVIHNAVGEQFINMADNPEVLKRYNIEEKKYILSVATLNKRKNIPELIRAFESISDKYPELKLVLVGGIGNEQRENLSRHKNIIFTGYIKDEDIPVLYKHALMYIFPSVYEGFGTPVMEAQYLKVPLICSDIPIFRDTAGKGAEFCSPDRKGIAEKTELLINNPERREELIRLGSENVKRYDIERVAEQLTEAINN